MYSLTEVLFENALRRTADLDQFVEREGKSIGPLHGVIVTLKDQFNVQGFDSTLGYVERAFLPTKDDAVLVKMLHHLGAIMLAKSNLPQIILVCIYLK